MRVIFIFLFLFITHLALCLQADNSFENVFKEGIQAYQAKEFEKSLEMFIKAHKIQPNNPYLLTNLGLAHYQNKNHGLAIGLWRKAISLNPKIFTAQSALDYALKQLEVKEIPHQIQTWEQVRQHLIKPFSIHTLLSLTGFLLLLSGWNLLYYWGQKKEALNNQTTLPKTPLISMFFLSLSFCFVILSGAKIFDYYCPRATIIPKEVPIFAGPSENQPTLFTLYEGLEVIIKKYNKDWVQVSYPGGMTGWVDQKNIFHSSGKAPW